MSLALITALMVFRLVAVPGFPEQDAYCFQTFTTAHNASVDAGWKYHHVHTNVATESILKNWGPVSKSKCTCNSCECGPRVPQRVLPHTLL